MTPDRSKSDPNNKDNNKANNSNNTHTFIQGTLTRGKNQPIVPIGPKRVVHMTLHQYANLLRAFGVHGAVGYVKRMEKMILTGGDFFGDHFKTIVGWARKDGLLTPEAEEILIS